MNRQRIDSFSASLVGESRSAVDYYSPIKIGNGIVIADRKAVEEVKEALGQTSPPRDGTEHGPAHVTAAASRIILDLQPAAAAVSLTIAERRAGLEELGGFVLEEGRAVYRPVGSVSFDEAVVLVRAAIAAAHRSQVRDLLVDTTALTGFSSPDTFRRFLAAVAWSDEARGRLRLAMVARAEMIDPKKFGVTVAANRGLVSNIFTTEVEAQAWLDARRGPEP